MAYMNIKIISINFQLLLIKYNELYLKEKPHINSNNFR